MGLSCKFSLKPIQFSPTDIPNPQVALGSSRVAPGGRRLALARSNPGGRRIAGGPGGAVRFWEDRGLRR
jgi:hypothetical protein